MWLWMVHLKWLVEKMFLGGVYGGGDVNVDGTVTVVCCRSVFKMCVVGDLFVVVDLCMIYCCVMSCVIVTCYRSEASGIYMECVVVVVMVDNG